jgi:hypothetical protein
MVKAELSGKAFVFYVVVYHAWGYYPAMLHCYHALVLVDRSSDRRFVDRPCLMLLQWARQDCAIDYQQV